MMSSNLQKTFWGLLLVAAIVGAVIFLRPSTSQPEGVISNHTAKNSADAEKLPVSEEVRSKVETPVIQAKPLSPEKQKEKGQVANRLRKGLLEGAPWTRFELYDARHIAQMPEYKAIVEELRALGPEAFSAITELMNEFDSVSIKGVLLMTLGDLQLKEGTGLLDQFLNGKKSITMESSCSYALGRLQTTEAFAVLTNFLGRDHEEWLSDDFYEAMGSYGKAALPFLLKEAEAKTSTMKNPNISAGHSLLGLIRGEDLLPELQNIFATHSNPQVRAMALHAMIKNGGEKNFPLLLSILESEKDPVVLKTAVQGFGNMKTPEAAQFLLGWVEKKKNAQLAWDAAVALRDLGSTLAVPALINWANNPETMSGSSDIQKKLRYATLEAIARIGGEEAMAFLEGCIQKDKGELRDQAVKALSLRVQGDGTPGLRSSLIASLADLSPESQAWALRFLTRSKESKEQVVRETVSLLNAVQEEPTRRGLMQGLTLFKGPEVAEAVVPLALHSENKLNRMLAFEIMSQNSEDWKAPAIAASEEKKLFRDTLDKFSNGDLLGAVPVDFGGEFGRSLLIDFMGRVGKPEDLTQIDKVSAQYSQDPKFHSIALASKLIAQRIREREKLH